MRRCRHGLSASDREVVQSLRPIAKAVVLNIEFLVAEWSEGGGIEPPARVEVCDDEEHESTTTRRTSIDTLSNRLLQEPSAITLFSRSREPLHLVGAQDRPPVMSEHVALIDEPNRTRGIAPRRRRYREPCHRHRRTVGAPGRSFRHPSTGNSDEECTQ